MTLRTHQTGPEGRVVRRLLIEQGMDLSGSKEMYLAILRRPRQRAAGVHGLRPGRHGHRGGRGEGPEGDPEGDGRPGGRASGPTRPASSPSASASLRRSSRRPSRFMLALYRAFEGTDASLVEINPFLVTKAGDVLALDAKINFDDNALFRHPELVELRDLDEEEPARGRGLEARPELHQARRRNVGCMVNGAGLAMATMDIIKLAGGRAGQLPRRRRRRQRRADQERLPHPARRPDVKAVLINIFGGILRCDVLAEGVIAAVRDRRRQGAGGRAHEGHQRGPGAGDARGVRASTSRPRTT